jgi:phosphoacetylglucosamine mutase
VNTQSSFYPPPEGVKLKYGTAGFREKAAILDSTFFRMGMLGILRSRQLEKTIGLMVVTASHNAAPDNGRPTAISSPVAPQRRRAGPGSA